MKLNNKLYEFISYTILIFLCIFIFSLTFKYKFKTVQDLNFNNKVNLNSNANSNNQVKETFDNLKEGYTSKKNLDSKEVNTENIFNLIDNKLKGIIQELGGDKGKNAFTCIFIWRCIYYKIKYYL